MHAGDQGESYSEPWTYRNRVIPERTYSGRVVYNRKKHFFRVEDAERVLQKLVPPDDMLGDTWAEKVVEVLHRVTIDMMKRLMPLFPEYFTEKIYDWSIGLLDQLFRIPQEDARKESIARRLINFIASDAGLTVTIK